MFAAPRRPPSSISSGDIDLSLRKKSRTFVIVFLLIRVRREAFSFLLGRPSLVVGWVLVRVRREALALVLR